MSVADSTKLKGLETKYKQVEAKRNIVIKETKDKQAEAKSLKLQLGKIKQEMDRLKTKKSNELIVSEHAILRYIERVVGINLDEVVQKIVSDDDKTIIASLGNCTYAKADFKLKVKDGVVVTILGENEND